MRRKYVEATRELKNDFKKWKQKEDEQSLSIFFWEHCELFPVEVFLWWVEKHDRSTA